MFIKRLNENVVDYLGQKYWLEEGFGNRENSFQIRAEKKNKTFHWGLVWGLVSWSSYP